MHLYIQNGWLKKVEILLENDFVIYKEWDLMERKVYRIPFKHFSETLSFSRQYHAPFFIPPLFLGFLSVRLILARWETGGWTLNLGWSILTSIALIGLYYLLVGKHTGEVELSLGTHSVSLFMPYKKYLSLQNELLTWKTKKSM